MQTGGLFYERTGALQADLAQRFHDGFALCGKLRGSARKTSRESWLQR